MPRYRRPKLTPEIKTSPKLSDWFAEREISEQTYTELGIYLAGNKIAFPYKVGDEVWNVKYRTRDKKFSQEPNAEKSLYNVNNVKNMAVFVEGEMDVVSLYEAGVTCGVTLPDGAPSETNFDKNSTRYAPLAQLEDCEKIVLAGDNDGPGQALMRELAHRFGADRCWKVEWPGTIKDANEFLKVKGPGPLKDLIDNAQPMPIEGLYGAGDYHTEVLDIYHGRVQQPLSTGFPMLDINYKIQPGTFNLFTGTPGHGKSMMVDSIAVNLARNEDWKFCVFSPEHSTPMHIRRLAEKIVRKPFDPGPSERMSEAELTKAMEFIGKHFYWIESREAVPSMKFILEKTRPACIRHGIKGVIIDPFNEIDASRGGLREDEFIRDLIAECKKFIRSHELWMAMVAHPTKLKRKENGDFPVVTLSDVAGGAMWYNKIDAGLVVSRNHESGETTITVRKIKEEGLYGTIGEVVFDYDTVTKTYKEKLPVGGTQGNIYEVAK